MRKRLNKSFQELVNENKKQLMNDDNALRRIDEKVDAKYTRKELVKHI